MTFPVFVVTMWAVLGLQVYALALWREQDFFSDNP